MSATSTTHPAGATIDSTGDSTLSSDRTLDRRRR
jgi:hypothetical protein